MPINFNVIGANSVALGGGVDHLMVGDAVDYDLPFKVYGHYDLRYCERTQERQY